MGRIAAASRADILCLDGSTSGSPEQANAGSQQLPEAHAGSSRLQGADSIDHEKLCPTLSVGAESFAVVGDLVAHTKLQGELSPVFKFGVKLAFDIHRRICPFTHQWSAK
jgi:hypothetical protein